MAVSGTGDWPLRSPRANRPPWHREQLLFGRESNRATLINDLFFGTPAGGGSLYTENLSETASLAEAIGNLALYAPSLAETVSLSEGVGTIATLAVALSESVSVAEALATLLTMQEALSEAIALSDNEADGIALGVALAEVIELSESLSGDKVRNTYMLPRMTTRWRMP